jgi:radical SAM protein with 4Fe4S-binding SPASM domain
MKLKRPYVISWNLTYRCNLACEHCYLDATSKPGPDELDTEACRGIIDQIAEFAPEAIVILTGGEPLLRPDIMELVRHGASRDLWMMLGTNGVKITADLAGSLKQAGLRGLAISIDSLDAETHDRFRNVKGAWQNAVEGAELLHAAGLPFIVQTTVGHHNAGELVELAEMVHSKLAATAWNLFFLVPTGRGQFVSDLDPAEYDRILEVLHGIRRAYQGKMLVNAKCAPQHVRTLTDSELNTPALATYAGSGGGCPAGTHYMGIRPNGDVTPCPYLPWFGGNLKQQSLKEIWNASPEFMRIRRRGELTGRCGECELADACGGCRARAYAQHGDVLAEDPLCTHEPGTANRIAIGIGESIEYGQSGATELIWEPEARERLSRIPVFVRGMVSKRVEAYCRKQGIGTVTSAVMQDLRARMPRTIRFDDKK